MTCSVEHVSGSPLSQPGLRQQVADLVKMDRLNRLNRVVNEVAEERAQRFADRDLEVLDFDDDYDD